MRLEDHGALTAQVGARVPPSHRQGGSTVVRPVPALSPACRGPCNQRPHAALSCSKPASPFSAENLGMASDWGCRDLTPTSSSAASSGPPGNVSGQRPEEGAWWIASCPLFLFLLFCLFKLILEGLGGERKKTSICCSTYLYIH